MKKLFFVAISLLLLGPLYGNKTDMFSYKLSEIEKDFESMNAVESIVLQNPGITYEELKNENPVLTQNFSYASNSSLNRNGNPDFIWGIVAGVGSCVLVTAIAYGLLLLLLIEAFG